MTTDEANRTTGETVGPEQVPTEAGDQDPAKRDPRPGGPMDHSTDPADANQELGKSPDKAYGQREGQADSETGQEST
jgi:hypothetical protein